MDFQIALLLFNSPLTVAYSGYAELFGKTGK